MKAAQPETNDTPIRFLLSRLIDYAGIFPPASLGMDEAVHNYEEYRKSEYAWMLGRFILPVSRLGEFELAARHLLPGDACEPWPFSVLAGIDGGVDAKAILDFNTRRGGVALIDAFEVKTALPKGIHAVGEIPLRGVDLFCEIPIDSDLEQSVRAIRLAGAHAKVRTGGVTSDLFPSASDLAAFMRTCCRETVSFKATAGLHHAMRGTYRLTYEETSGTAVMHGFLNVFLAAAFILAGMEMSEATHVLEEREAQAFRFGDSAVQWRSCHLRAADLEAARRNLAVGFGSCSFMEPISELKKLDLI